MYSASFYHIYWSSDMKGGQEGEIEGGGLVCGTVSRGGGWPSMIWICILSYHPLVLLASVDPVLYAYPLNPYCPAPTPN